MTASDLPPGFDVYRALIEQVVEHAIFMIAPDGRALTWNPGVQRVFGYDEAEWLGRHTAELFTPEDRAADAPARELKEAADRGQASDDRWAQRKDGTRFWASGITTSLHDASGRLVGFAKVARDLTQQRRAEEALVSSEERLRLALRAGRMGIWRWDFDASSQEMDDRLAQLLGLQPGDRVTTLEGFLRHVHSDDRERVRAAFEASALTGGRLDIELRVVWADGTLRWLSHVGEVVANAEGKPVYLTGAVTDVTERKLSESRLVEAQRMDAVGHLAGGVAHEINNMMTAVIGFSELLLLQLHDSDRRRANVEQIRLAAGRAATITAQLLAFGRRQMLHPRILVLNDVVRCLEPVLRSILGEDKQLETSFDPELGAVRADEVQLEQVLLNLALNARDAMTRGGRLTLSTSMASGPPVAGAARTTPDGARTTGRSVVLTVTDTGHGMDPATVARAFEPFFTTKPVGQGTGLGLSTVFGIVQQSGGSIRLRSAPGQGTSFELIFPEIVMAGPAAVSPAPGDIPGETRGRVVLVVEDEDLVRSYAVRYLELAGYRCVEAANGAEALAVMAAAEGEVALVVSDMVMPVMGGRELAERVARLYPDVPVVLMTGYTQDGSLRRGVAPPGDPILRKPFTPSELAAKVRAALGD